MNIAEYRDTARSTAIYPDGARFFYPALGLAGEVGESMDKMYQPVEGQAATQDEIRDELGDILWYVVNTAADVDIAFQDLVDINCSKAVVDFNEVHENFVLPADTRHFAKKFPIYVGRISEIAKKALRDSKGEVPAAKQYIVLDSLAVVLGCIYEAADVFSLKVGDIAQSNLDKLLSRKDRGVLQGDGDNR